MMEYRRILSTCGNMKAMRLSPVGASNVQWKVGRQICNHTKVQVDVAKFGSTIEATVSPVAFLQRDASKALLSRKRICPVLVDPDNVIA